MRNFLVFLLLLVLGGVGIVFLYSRPAATTVPEATTAPATGQETTKAQESSPSAMNNTKTYSKPPAMTIDPKKTYTATMTTSKGPITIELFANETPNTVNNFFFLAKEGFYNNTTFHRIIKDFMIQGGDPKGDGTGGPGYKFPDEKITRDYKKGIVAMANSGPNTNGSQFFIMHGDTSLPKNYVIFGQVTKGLDTVDAIANVTTMDNGYGEKSTPTEKIMVKSVTIEEK